MVGGAVLSRVVWYSGMGVGGTKLNIAEDQQKADIARKLDLIHI